MAIARLHCSGLIKFVATTNVDDLHCKSGLPKESLAELHGNSFVEECEKCLKQYKQSFVTRTATGLFEHRTGRYRSKKHRVLVFAIWSPHGRVGSLCGSQFFKFSSYDVWNFEFHIVVVVQTLICMNFFWSSWKVLWVRWTFAGYHCELWKYLWTRSFNGRSAWCCMGSLFDSWAKWEVFSNLDVVEKCWNMFLFKS